MTTGAPPVDGKSSVWKDPSLVGNFLQRVRKGVPLAQIQLDVMMRVIAGPEEDLAQGEQSVHSFLDLGCGDGILAGTILEKYPHAKGTLVDFSMPMLQAALQNLKAYSKSLHVSSVDYTDPSWFDIVSSQAPFDVVCLRLLHSPPSRFRQEPGLHGHLRPAYAGRRLCEH